MGHVVERHFDSEPSLWPRSFGRALGSQSASFAAGATSGNDDRLRISPIHSGYFVVYVVVQLIRSNLSLARKILTRTNMVNAGVIAVPMRTCGEMTMLVMSNVITLTPGTITIEAKGSPAVLYVNVLHLDDAERVRNELHQLESVCVRAFGSARRFLNFVRHACHDRIRCSCIRPPGRRVGVLSHATLPRGHQSPIVSLLSTASW